MDPEEYRQSSLATWAAMAAGWEAWRGYIEASEAPVRDWMIRELAPRAGETVLELSAGAGDTGFAAAAIVGAGGRLISSDFSQDMVEIARRRGAELGVANSDYLVIDAERIELPADSVDGVLCRFGYMLMSDPASALSETRRVLRPGGRLALAVWGPPERNAWAGIAASMLIQSGHMPPPEPGAPGVFSMASDERTRSMLQAGGFSDVRLEEVPVRWDFSDLDEYEKWGVETGGPFAMVLRGLSEGERSELKTRLASSLAPFVVEGQYQLPGVALCAVAS